MLGVKLAIDSPLVLEISNVKLVGLLGLCPETQPMEHWMEYAQLPKPALLKGPPEATVKKLVEGLRILMVVPEGALK